jgi:hypothetical protein
MDTSGAALLALLDRTRAARGEPTDSPALPRVPSEWSRNKIQAACDAGRSLEDWYELLGEDCRASAKKRELVNLVKDFSV